MRPSRGDGESRPAHVDGMDVCEVRRATASAVARARDGYGPTFLEFDTYRFAAHHIGDASTMTYRTKEEVELWRGVTRWKPPPGNSGIAGSTTLRSRTYAAPRAQRRLRPLLILLAEVHFRIRRRSRNLSMSVEASEGSRTVSFAEAIRAALRMR